MDPPILSLTGIRKRFGEVAVLHGVDLDVRRGEVHALVGENGAGKSTLMRIAAGIHRADAGRVTFAGREFAPRSPADALRAGIAMVHQELSLAPDLSVAENIHAGREPRRGWFLDSRRLYERAAAVLSEFCPAVDPAAPVASLGPGYRQVVEVLKALAWEPKVIVFDEPTSSLEAHETELVLATIGKLRARSVGVVYISHRMDEVFRTSDRITVLRDGRRVATWPTSQVPRSDVVAAMVGRHLADRCRPAGRPIGPPLLAVSGLSRRGAFRDVHFELHQGEILGFSGLVGAGRTELMRAIFGADSFDSGTIVLDGRTRRFRSIRDAVLAGIAYLPEDRKTQGLFLDRSLQDNLLCGNLRQCSRAGVVRGSLSRALAEACCRRLGIRARDLDQEMWSLSGGNQQKALLARWLAASPRVLIADEPTRGVDVGAKAEIHRLLTDHAAAGNGVIVVSSEMPELIELCDRILVMHEGRLAGGIPGPTATEQDLIRLATGSPAPSP
jgi:ribose transport system ATP-binding protein